MKSVFHSERDKNSGVRLGDSMVFLQFVNANRSGKSSENNEILIVRNIQLSSGSFADPVQIYKIIPVQIISFGELDTGQCIFFFYLTKQRLCSF